MKCRFFSVLACLAILVGLPAAGNAAIVSVSNLPPNDFPLDLGENPTFSHIYSVTRFQFGPSSSFNHIFGFSLSTDRDFRAVAVAPNFGGGPLFHTHLDRMRLFTDLDGDGPTAFDTLIAGDATGPFYVISEYLSAGSYYLRVAGDTSGFLGGQYFFAADTAGGSLPAIPEPSTYALMVAGLGMIAFITRRRQRQTARI